MESPQCSAWNYTMHPLWSIRIGSYDVLSNRVRNEMCLYLFQMASRKRGVRSQHRQGRQTEMQYCLNMGTMKLEFLDSHDVAFSCSREKWQLLWHGKGELERDWSDSLSQPGTAGQSHHEMGVSVNSSVSEMPLYSPPNLLLERCVCQSPVVLNHCKFIICKYFVGVDRQPFNMLYIGSLQGLMRVYERESTEDHVCMIF